MENINLVQLIRQAKDGNKDAMLELLRNFEPLIIKLSLRYTNYVDQDCYQELAVQFIVAVYSFDLSRYTNE